MYDADPPGGGVDFDQVFTPDKFIKVDSVPILDEHTIPKSRGGPVRQVDAATLKKIAANNNARWKTRDATPIVIGHTDDDAPESEQPEIAGWAVNFTTGPFFETGKEALFADFYFKKSHADAIEKYPRRSVEFWPSRLSVDPISILSSTSPERDLSVLKFARDAPEKPYRYSISLPENLMPNPQTKKKKPVKYAADDETDDKEMPTAESPGEKDALEVETKPYKELAGKVDEIMKELAPLKEMAQQFQVLMEELMKGGEEGQEGEAEGMPEGDGEGEGREELLEPDDEQDEQPEPDEEGEPEAEGGEDGEAKKDDEQRKDHEPGPVKFGCGPTSTNSFIPEGPKKMSRKTDENEVALKYERKLEEVQKTYEAKFKEHALKFQRMRAEKVMGELESGPDAIDFVDEKTRKDELDLLSRLGDGSFEEHVRRMKLLYRRKPKPTPNSESLDEVVKFSRTPEQGEAVAKSPEDVQKVVAKALAEGLSYAEYLKKHTGK